MDMYRKLYVYLTSQIDEALFFWMKRIPGGRNMPGKS